MPAYPSGGSPPFKPGRGPGKPRRVTVYFGSPQPPPIDGLVQSADALPVAFTYQFQYQAIAAPAASPEALPFGNPNKQQWFQPLSEPVRTRWYPTGEQPVLAQGAVPPMGSPASEQWFNLLSEPVRTRWYPTAEQSTATLGTPSWGSPASADWLFPLSDPVRTRWFPTAEQPTPVLGEPSLGSPGFMPWPPWSEPVRPKPRTPDHFVVAPTQTTAEVVTVDKWFDWLSDPVRTRRLAEAHQQSLAWVLADTADTKTAEQVHESNWHFAWSEPVRLPQRLLAGAQPDSAFLNLSGLVTSVASAPTGGYVTFPYVFQYQAFVRGPETDEILKMSSWFRLLSEPVRTRQIATAQQPTSILGEPPLGSPGNRPEWFSPLSEPVRLKPRAPDFPYLAYADRLLVSLDEWYVPLHDPVRIPRRILADEQPPSAYAERVLVSLDEWFASFRDPPVLARPRLLDARQQFFAFQPNPIIKIDWWAPLAEPIVKMLPRLRDAVQQSVTMESPFNERITTDKWIYPWTDPVRFRRLAIPQFPSVAAPAYPTTLAMLQAFLQALEKGDAAAFSLIGTVRQGNLTATEFKDLAFFDMRQINPPAGCMVTIRELRSGDGAISITELH